MKKKVFLIPLAMFMVTGTVGLAACDTVEREQPTQPSDDTKTLVGIAVDTPPTKTEYIDGDDFDPTGLKIKASYTDGTSEIVDGWTVDKTKLAVGDNVVTISYTKGTVTLTTTVSITVNPKVDPGTKTLTGITVTTPPTKTHYDVGEVFDKAGMVVTASYSNSDPADVTELVTTDKDGVPLTADDKVVTVSYTEGDLTVTDTVDITVGDEPTPPGPDAPEHAGTIEDPYTTSDAKIVCDGLKGQTSGMVYVEGIVAATPAPKQEGQNDGKGVTFYTTDGKTSVQNYFVKGIGGVALDVSEIEAGDHVVVQGVIKDYNGTVEICWVRDQISCELVEHSKPTPADIVSVDSVVQEGLPTQVEVGESIDKNSIWLNVTYSNGNHGLVNPDTITFDNTVAATGVEVSCVYGTFDPVTFTINVVAKAEKVVGDFYKVKSQSDIVEGQYLLVWEGDKDTRVFTGVDAANDFVTAENQNGHIAAGTYIKVELEAMDGGFAMKVVGGENDGKYMYGTSGSNGLKFGTNKVLHTIEHKAERDLIICDSTYLSYNTNTSDQRFRYYKADTQKPVHLYKMYEQQEEPAVTSVVVNPSEKTLDKNEEAQLSAVVTAVGGASEAVTWSSSDNTKVSVDANGKIKGLAETTEPVIITATSNFDNSKKGTCSVTVTSQEILPEVISVELSDSSKTLTVNDSFTLTPTVSVVGGASEAVTWSSSDSTKVSVADGVVTAVEVTEEPVVITATSVDDPTKSATCSVTVIAEKVIDVDKAVELTSDIITHEKPTDYGTNENGDYAYVNLLKNTQGTPESIQGTGTVSESRPDKSILYNSIAFSKAIVGIKLEIGTKAAGATATANLTFGTSAKAAGSNKVTLSGSSGTADYKTLDSASSTIEFKLEATGCKYFALNFTSGAAYFSKITLIFDESYVPAQPTVKSVSVNPAEKEISVNEEFTLTPVVEVENGAAKTVTWSSSDNTKVSVDANGKIKGLAETTEPVTITATSTEDTEKSGSCSVTVVKAQLSNYTLLTSATDLYVGDKVVIAAAGSSVAAGTASDKNNRPEAAIVKTDNKLGVLGADVQVFELEAGTVDGTYAFKTDAGYLYAVANSNYMKTKATKDASCDFSISCTDAGIATVSTTVGNRTMRYNSGSKLFSCYQSGQADIALYHIPYNEPTEGLKSISVSGPAKTEYELNEAFNPEGLVVTASYYGDAKDTDVTASATYDAPDMTTEGIKEVVVSYTEGGVTKTDSFSIKVGEAVAEKGTLENPYTGAEAYAIANAMAQTKTAASCGSVYIKGIVQEFKQVFSTDYGNYSFAIEDGFICWQLKNGENKTSFVGGELSIGDEVIVKAEIQKFSDTQMETLGGYIHSITRGTSTIELGSSSSENATIDLKGISSALNGSTLSFDVSVDAEYEIASVKVNGVDATLVTEGTYSFVVDGPSKIVVETKKVGEKDPEVYKSGVFNKASFSAGSTNYASGAFTCTTKQADNTDFVVSFQNAANNNKGWDCAALGSKNADVTSTMSVGKMDVALCSIGMTFDAFNAGNVTSVIAYASSDEGSTWNEVGSLSKDDYSTGTKEIKLSGTSAGMMYKVVFVMTKASANAIIKISAATFNYIPE